MTNSQVQITFTKLVFLSDINALVKLGETYPFMQHQVGDVICKYNNKLQKLNKLLVQQNLAEIEVGNYD